MKRLRFMVIVALMMVGGSASACRFAASGNENKAKQRVRQTLPPPSKTASANQTAPTAR